MIRFLAQSVVSLIANALGLIVASLMLDGLSIDSVSFVLAVVVFTLTTMIMGPFILKIALTGAPFLVGGIALVTTFVGLVVTDLFSDGLSISGATTIVAATFIVWMFSLIANVLLPFVIFKKTIKGDKQTSAE